MVRINFDLFGLVVRFKIAFSCNALAEWIKSGSWYAVDTKL
jgi:hypothetical protein